MNKEELLKEVWKNCSFEDILNAGLELKKITSSDIIHASDIYIDPEHEYTDNDISGIVEQCDLTDICERIDNKYKLDEILSYWDQSDILDTMDDDDILIYLEDSWALDNHDSEIKEQSYNDGYEDGIKEYEFDEKSYIDIIRDYNADNMWCWLCDYFGLSYYDNNGLYHGLVDLVKKLNKSMYKDKNESQWINIIIDN